MILGLLGSNQANLSILDPIGWDENNPVIWGSRDHVGWVLDPQDYSC